MSCDELFRWGLRSGLTPAEVRRTRVRDLFLCRQTTARAERSQWRQALTIVNAMPFREEMVTLDDLYEADRRTRSARDQTEYEAFKGRTADWGHRLVTDHSAPEM